VVGFADTVIHLLRVIEDCLREKSILVAPISRNTEDTMEDMLQELREVMERTSMVLRERQR
jgi:hypothetical protein